MESQLSGQHVVFTVVVRLTETFFFFPLKQEVMNVKMKQFLFIFLP